MMKVNPKIGAVLALLAGVALLISYTGAGAQAQTAPRYKFEPDWPKLLPNKWKMGGVTGLAVDKDDNVWVYDRPNDLTTIELEAELPLGADPGVGHPGERDHAARPAPRLRGEQPLRVADIAASG